VAIDFSQDNAWTGTGTTTYAGGLTVTGAVSANTYSEAPYFWASSTATSTFAGGLDVLYINQTGSVSTSTFATGIDLTNGCFAVNGTCVGGAGGSGTVNSGTQGQVAYYDTAGTAVSGTSTLTITQAGDIGIGTSTPESGFNIYNRTLKISAGIPTLINSTTTAAFIKGIHVQGGYAYAVNDGAGSTQQLEIYNISDADTINEIPKVGGLALGDIANNVHVYGNYAYIATELDGSELQIVDISNPTNPVLLGTGSTTNSYAASDLALISSKYLLVGSYSSTLGYIDVFDISEPTNPVRVFSQAASSRVNAVAVSHPYAYIGTNLGGEEFEIFDISDPLNPVEVGGYDASDQVMDIYISGSIAYIVQSSGDEVEAIDISDPTNPTKLGGASTVTTGRGVIALGDYVYVTASSGGDALEVFDFSSTTNPVRVATTDLPSFGWEIFSYGTQLYVTHGLGFEIFEIAGIETPGAVIGSVLANNINVQDNIFVGQNANISGQLYVGQGGIYSIGPVTVTGYSSTTLTENYTAFNVQNGFSAFGTSTSYSKLSLWNDATANGSRLFEVINRASTTLFLIDDNGNVGIGTSTPGATLSVGGDILGNIIYGANFVATSTATSTFAGAIDVTESNATSTFAGGIRIEGGTLRMDQFADCTGGNTIDFQNGIFICGTDASGGGGGGTGAFFELMSDVNYGAPTSTLTELAVVVGTTTAPTSVSSLLVFATSSDTVNFIEYFDRTGQTGTSRYSVDVTGLITANGGFVSQASSTITGNLTITGDATTTSATTTDLHISGDLNISGDIISDFAGTGLTVSAGALGIDLSQNLAWTGTGTTTYLGGLDLAGALAANTYIEAPYFWASSTSATSTFAGGLAIETSGFVYDYSSNRVGIGTAAPTSALHIAGSARVDSGDFDFYRAANGSSANTFNFFKSRGSIASPTTVSQDDTIGYIDFSGYDGDAYRNRASIRGYVEGSVSGSNVPIAITFSTIPNSDTLLERMRITSSGEVGIGTTTPGALLSVGGDILGNIIYGANFYATSTATSTFAGGLDVLYINQTGSVSTSTFATGIDLTNGCFSIGGSCVGGGGGGGAFTSSGGFTTMNTASDLLGIGTSTPYAKLSVLGDVGAQTPLLALATSTGTTTFAVSSSGALTISQIDPTFASSTSDGSGGALKVFVSGNYAYVADHTDGLEIYDISDPKKPVKIGSVDDGGNANDVFVSGNYAYVADLGDGLEIIDVSDPATPFEVGEVDDGGNARAVFVSGNYAYIADDTDGLEIIDISDPSNPVEVGSVDDGNNAMQVFVSGNYAYVADFTDGLEIIDISDPTNPVEVGSVFDTGSARDVFVSGNYAYVADDTDGLEIIDISSSTNPFEVGSVADGGQAFGIFVSGNYAYVADSGDGLEIIDISSSTNPVEVGSYDDGGLARGIFVSGNYAYVADFNDGLEIFELNGITATAAEIGTLKSDIIETNRFIADSGIFNTGLNVGRDTLIGGALTITGNASSTLVENYTALNISYGNLVFGTSTASSTIAASNTKLLLWGDTNGTGRFVFEVISSASTTLFTIDDGGNATTTGYLAVTGSSATSTFANGIRIEGGTLRMDQFADCTGGNTIDFQNGIFICGSDTSGGGGGMGPVQRYRNQNSHIRRPSVDRRYCHYINAGT